MRLFAATLAIGLLFSPALQAGEKIMQCDDLTFKLISSRFSDGAMSGLFKKIAPLVGVEDQIFRRTTEGGWEEWCKTETINETATVEGKTHTWIWKTIKTLGDKGAKCQISLTPKTAEDAKKYAGMKSTTVVDFVLQTQHTEGTRLGDGYDLSDKISCKMLD